MPVIIGEKRSGPYYKRMIRCPGHWLVDPKEEIYRRVPVDLLKDCSDYVEYQGKRMKIRKTKILKDKYGNKLVDWKKMYELRRKGKVLHPPISAAEAIERVYDPESYLCKMCDKRCKEGQGRVITTNIKRLNR